MMPKKRIAAYLHLVWATWDRKLWITSDIERQVFRIIVSQVSQLGCKTIVINGMPDHIHILLKFPTTITIAELVKKSKGVSSRYINQSLIPDDHFKWQIGYGAFTVSRWDTDRLKKYINRQKQHHNEGNLIRDLEEIKESVPGEGRSAKLG
jgi:putative transposase